MKKYGFTLAEVLITLAIIGVVATLTLPALMTNTAEQQAKTALKKGINTLTEAAQMNQAIAGFDYSSISSNDTNDATAQSLYGILANRTNVDYENTAAASKDGSNIKTTLGTAAGNTVVFLKDGAAIIYSADGSLRTGAGGNVPNNTMQDDNLVYGFPIIYDTNGLKGPNLLSNCQGNATLVSKDVTAGDQSDAIGKTTGTGSEAITSTVDSMCTNTNRVIKDQFGLRLRGGFVQPNGAAARWAFDK